MKKQIKLKKKIKIYLFIVLILIIGAYIGNKKYQEYKYHQTYEYKLLEKKYDFNEVKLLEKKLNETELNTIVNKDYNSIIPKLIGEKYFLFKNLDRYINHYAKNLTYSTKDIVALINTNRDYSFYDNSLLTNIESNELMLVNKYNNLTKDYIPKDLVRVSSSFAFANNMLNKTAYDAFKTLSNEAKNNDYTIVINSSYRDYDTQNNIWKARKEVFGTKKADDYAARAGHSEHQSGYAIDVVDYNDKRDSFEKTEAYEWMKNNSYKFGFILRYPENKENITGYAFEAWHYRYVGQDIAKKIYQEDITFDEYYAYYINNK